MAHPPRIRGGVARADRSPIFREARRPSVRIVFDAPLRIATAPDIAIDAIAVLVRIGFDASLVFIAGPEDDPNLRSDLAARARALRIEEQIRFDGTNADWENADAALVLHRWAGENIEAALRAMHAGVPIVAYPKGGARTFFDEHPLAARAKSCSGFDVAHAVDDLASDELARRRLATKAKAFAMAAGRSLEPA